MSDSSSSDFESSDSDQGIEMSKESNLSIPRVNVSKPGGYHGYYSDNYESDDGGILDGDCESEYTRKEASDYIIEPKILATTKLVVQTMESALDYYESSMSAPTYNHNVNFLLRSALEEPNFSARRNRDRANQTQRELKVVSDSESESYGESNHESRVVDLEEPLDVDIDADNELDSNSPTSLRLSPTPPPRKVLRSLLYSPPGTEYTPISPTQYQARKEAKQTAASNAKVAAERRAALGLPSINHTPSPFNNTQTHGHLMESPIQSKKRKQVATLFAPEPAQKKRVASTPKSSARVTNQAVSVPVAPAPTRQPIEDVNDAAGYRANDVPSGYTKDQWCRAYRRYYQHVTNQVVTKNWKNLVSLTVDTVEAKKLAAKQGPNDVRAMGYAAFRKGALEHDLTMAAAENHTLQQYLVRLDGILESRHRAKVEKELGTRVKTEKKSEKTKGRALAPGEGSVAAMSMSTLGRKKKVALAGGMAIIEGKENCRPDDAREKISVD